MDNVTDQIFDFLVGQKAERGHGGPFDARLQGPHEVFATRLAFLVGLAARGELEDARTIVTRVRIYPGGGRTSAVATQSVTMQTVQSVQRAAASQRLVIELQILDG